MKFLKTLSLLVLSLFLISTASAAIVTYLDWSDGSVSATINDGDTISFRAEYFSMDPPINLKIALYDSSNNPISEPFLQTTTNEYNFPKFTKVYIINKAIYGGIGNFTVRFNASDSQQEHWSEISLRVTSDTIAPVITLLGSNPQQIIRGGAYTELGATALDNLDGDLTSSISIDSSNVNTSQFGTYSVVYTVTDSAGNTGTSTRTVEVVSSIPDTTAPVIAIQNPIDGGNYTSHIRFLHFIVTDANLDNCEYSTDNGTTRILVACTSGNLTSVAVNSVEGANTWTVYAEDASGNTANQSVSFTVDLSGADTTAPTITILAPEDKEYTNDRITFRVITDEEADVEFSLDGRSRITMNNAYDNVYTYTLTLSNGEHTVKFYATDTSGNEANKSIDFSVDDGSSKGGTSTPALIIPTRDTTDTDTSIIVLDNGSVKKSFFQQIIDAIINFFKWLFGVK